MRSINRLSSLHQRECLPNISAAVAELWEHNRNAQSRKSSIQVSSLSQLHTLSVVQSRASPIRPDLASIERELEASKASLAILKQMSQLPVIYGSLLVESVQRVEWSHRIKSLTGEVAEEFATWKEDEQKRRSKWLKRFGGSLDAFGHAFNNSMNHPSSSVNSISNLKNSNTSILAVELSLVGANDQVVSSAATREDVYEFVDILRQIPGTEYVTAELQDMINDLDRINRERPTGSSRRREKLFKDGSFMEQMRSSMFISPQQPRSTGSSRQQSPDQNDSMSESLEVENRRLQEQIKGYESRVRRLEDLLHRQQARGLAGLPSAGSGSGHLSNAIHSPPKGQPMAVARHHSAPSVNEYRQLSPAVPIQSSPKPNAQSPTLIQQQSSQMLSMVPLRSSPSPRNSSPISQSPRTSMAEFEASRKRGSASKLDRLQTELPKDPNAVVTDLQIELKEVQNSLNQEKETSTRLRKQISETQHNLQEIEVIKQDLLANLSQQEAEFQRERKSLNQEISALKAHIYAMEEAEDNLEESRVDKEGLIADLESALEEQQQRERDLEEVKSGLDIEIRNLRETLRAERDESSQLASMLGESSRVQSSLKNRTMQLEELLRLQAERSHDADDDDRQDEAFEQTVKDLEEAKSRLAATEENLLCLSEENHELRETVNKTDNFVRVLWHMLVPESPITDPSLEEFERVLTDRQNDNVQALSRLHDLEVDGATNKEYISKMKATLDLRSLRARDLTQRLYTFYRRSRQLMDALGISYTGSRSMALNGNMMEDVLYKILPESEREKWMAGKDGEQPSSEADMSIPDVEVLHWMDAPNLSVDSDDEEEARFARFLVAIDFDYNEFSDMVQKRVQEAEYIARKWNKMARLYREKARRAKKESSEKISYKS